MTTVANQISLVSYSGTIFDQQTQGSCKANQIVGALQMMSNMFGVDLPDLSRQQLYNDTRAIMGTFNTDSGSSTYAAEKAAMTIGIADESSFTYGLSNLYAKPSDSVHAEAADMKVQGFTHASEYGNSGFYATWIGDKLMQGKPVLVDAYVHYGFGIDPNSFLNPINAGHAYLIVGIDYTARTYTVQNSWGEGWANGGYGTIKFTDLPGIGPTAGGPWGTSYQDLLGISTIDGFGGTNLLWTTERVEVAQHYATVLGRAAEVSGLDWWASANLNSEMLTTSLLNSAEGQAIYGSMSNTQFVDAMYANVLGRAADASGAAFYLGFLDQGWSRGKIMDIVINAVEATNAEAAAHDHLLNLTNLSAYVSVTMQYQGGHDADIHAAMAQVTSDANALEVIKVGVQSLVYG